MKGLTNVLWALFILFIFGYLVGVVDWMYHSFFLTPEKDAVEYTIVEEQGQKGMFLNPRYQVLTDANETGNYVTKRVLETIYRGDKLQGHETFEYGFFTKIELFITRDTDGIV